MTFKPVSSCPDAIYKNMRVSDLILLLGGWNVGLIRLIFLRIDEDIICGLPNSRTGVEDKLIWHFDRAGRYTTKGEYHVAKSIRTEGVNGDDGSGSSTPSQGWIRNIWRVKIPNKIKHFSGGFGRIHC